MNRPLYYILADKKPTPEPDISVWGKWFYNVNIDTRTVQKTRMDTGAEVSTVFLGIDHNPYGEGPPILFETMVFGGNFDGEQWRYHTWDEATLGHDQVVEELLKEK